MSLSIDRLLKERDSVKQKIDFYKRDLKESEKIVKSLQKAIDILKAGNMKPQPERITVPIQKVLQHSESPLTVSEIQTSSGFSKSYIYMRLRELVKQKKVVKFKQGQDFLHRWNK